MRAGANQHAAVTIHAMFPNKFFSISLVAAIFIASTGCSPNFNWREVQGTDPSYTVLLPAKPSSHSRTVDLDGLRVTMTMTAAETDDVNFAVASIKVDDESQRHVALLTMQKAMLQNIHGDVTQQKVVALKDGITMTEIHATGKASTGRPLSLFARFGEHGHDVFQVVTLGPSDKLTSEIADTFLSSFTPH
jgi:hypothetical protein